MHKHQVSIFQGHKPGKSARNTAECAKSDKASKNLTWCEIFVSRFLGSLSPFVCKAQYRTSNWSTPTAVAAAEGDHAAAVMVPFTGKGYFSSKPASLTRKEQGGTSNLA